MFADISNCVSTNGNESYLFDVKITHLSFLRVCGGSSSLVSWNNTYHIQAACEGIFYNRGFSFVYTNCYIMFTYLSRGPCK